MLYMLLNETTGRVDETQIRERLREIAPPAKSPAVETNAVRSKMIRFNFIVSILALLQPNQDVIV